MFLKTKQKSLTSAEAALGSYNKVKTAIEGRVLALTPLIQARLEAETTLESTEASAALGEQSNTVAARKDLDKALAALDAEAVVLRGLRSRLGGLAGELIATRQRLEADLPSHLESVRSDFAKRWSTGVQAFGELLGERAALESLFGEPFALPGAAPSDYALAPEVTAPSSALTGLADAISDLAEKSRTARDSDPITIPGATVPTFDPGGVYQLQRRAGPLAAGTLVVSCSFSDGQLRHLVSLGRAVVYRRAASLAAEREARRIEQSAAQAREQQRRAAQRTLEDSQPYGVVVPATMYPDLSPEERRERLSGRLFLREHEEAEAAEANSPNILARSGDVDRVQTNLAQLRNE